MRKIALVTCKCCEKIVERDLSRYNRDVSRGQKNWYCSRYCLFHGKSIEIDCTQCGKTVRRVNTQAIRSKNAFCSRSCAAIYNNAHKTKGTTRSKLEKYLEEQLTLLFPDLEILFNCKDVINSELDIYIPKFKLAIELNGICHYKPIYGEKKLKEIQANDFRKIEMCTKHLITLVTVNTTAQGQWSSESSKEFLISIKELLNSYTLLPD